MNLVNFISLEDSDATSIIKPTKIMAFENNGSDNKLFLDIVNDIGVHSSSLIIVNPASGILIGLDKNGHPRKYVMAECVCCGHKWPARYDHVCHKSKRESRKGKDGTVCPYCYPLIYNKLNSLNISNEEYQLVYYIEFTVNGVVHQKVGKTSLTQSSAKKSKKEDTDDETAIKCIKDRFRQLKYYDLKILDYHFSDEPYFVESHIKKELESKFPNSYANINKELKNFLDGGSECFLRTNGINKEVFNHLCKTYELQAERIHNIDLKETWNKKYKLLYSSVFSDCITSDGVVKPVSFLEEYKYCSQSSPPVIKVTDSSLGSFI